MGELHHGWTSKETDDGHRSNSSDKFLHLVNEVNRLLRDGAAGSVLSHNWTERKAGQIMAQLAHVHNVGPLPTPPRSRGSYKHVGEEFVSSITGCARCHRKGHKDVTWLPLDHPFEDNTASLWTHWAPCPTNGQPILMASFELDSVEDESPQEAA